MSHIKRNNSRINLAAGILALEPRMMFDGAAVVDAAHAAADAAAKALIPVVAAPLEVRAADPSKDGGKKEVVFIDTSVADYRTLEAAVKDGVGIVEVDGGQSGLAQMAKWAEIHAGYDSISILSHGSEATLKVGTDVLIASSLSNTTVQAELADIGHALTAGGDLLLYGCDVAKGEDGQQFVTDLAAATGADVAASTDTTGHGGNWTLEYSSNSDKYVSGQLVDVVYEYSYDLLSVGNGTLTIYSIWNVSQTATGIKFSFNIYNSSTNTDGPFTIKGQWGAQTEHTLINYFNSAWGDYTAHDWGVTWADLGGAPTGGAGTKYVTFYLYASGTGIPLTGLSYQESFGYNPNATPAFVSSGTTNLTFSPGATAHDITSYLGVTDSDSSQTETWTQSVAPNNGGNLLFTSATGTSGAGTISPTGTVTYTPNASFVGTETFTVQVSDGTATATKAFSALVDNAPTVTAGSTTAYTERTPTTVAPAITVTDADGNSEWNGGTLAVNISANADATDKLYLATSQPGSAGYWVDAASSNAIKYWDGSANTTIGTASATQVTGSSTWTTTFNASATNALVSGLAQAILYDDNTHAPGTSSRTVHFAATDKWGLATAADQTVTIAAINEAPTLSGMSNAVTWYQGVGAATMDSGAAIADVELDAANSGNGNYAGASVSIVNHAGADANDVISVANGSGYTVSGGNISAGGHAIATFSETGGTFTLTFADNGTKPTTALVNDVLDHIIYSRTSPPSADGAQTAQLDWTFHDGNSGGQGSGGDLTSAGYSTVTLNRAPVVSAAQSTQTSVTGVAFTYQVPSGTFHDADADALTYSVQRVDSSGTLVNGGALPGWLSFTAGTRIFSGTSAASDAGASYFKVSASDGHSTTTDTVRIDVYNGPSVSSIDRAAGTTAYTNATSRDWTVTFNAAVSGVDTTDFSLVTTSGTATGAVSSATTAAGAIASVTDSGDHKTYTVTVTGVTGDGDLALNLNNAGTGITDISYGKAITGGFSGQAYTVDHTVPLISSISIPSATNKVGDVITATITLAADSGNDSYYTLGSAKTVDGFTLGSLSTVDATHLSATFTVTDGGGDVAASGGQIPVNLVLVDRAGNSSAAYTTAMVTTTGRIDANAPSNLALSTTDINQAGNANATVGTFSTTDLSSNSTFTYTLVAGAGSTDNAKVSISGNTLSVNNQTLTAGNSYSIRVRTTDIGGNSFDKVLTLRANTVPQNGPVPSAPKGVQGVNFSYPLPPGTFTDGDGDPFTYTATNLPPGLTINPTTGAISGTPSGTGTYTATITASDGHGGTTSQTATFSFDAPPHASPPPSTSGGVGLNGGATLGGGGVTTGTGTGTGISTGGGFGVPNDGGGSGWGGTSGGIGFGGGATAGGYSFGPSTGGAGSGVGATSGGVGTFGGTTAGGPSFGLSTGGAGSGTGGTSGGVGFGGGAAAGGTGVGFAGGTGTGGTTTGGTGGENGGVGSSGGATAGGPGVGFAGGTGAGGTTTGGTGGENGGVGSSGGATAGGPGVGFAGGTGTGGTTTGGTGGENGGVGSSGGATAGGPGVGFVGGTGAGGTTTGGGENRGVATSGNSAGISGGTSVAGGGGSAPGGAAANGSTGAAQAGVGGSGGVAVIAEARTASAPSAFQVAVAAKSASGGDALVSAAPVKDAAVELGSRISVQIPADSFAHTKADAVVTLSAQQATGAPLPGWMNFNPQSGTFEGTPPPGFKGEVSVKVVARDAEGREAVQTFTIKVGDGGQGQAAPNSDGQPQGGQPQAPGRTGMLKPLGRSSLTQQLRESSQHGRLAKQFALFQVVKANGRAA
ncbi:protein of unknown function（containing Cadherin-like domain,1230-1310;785-891;1645-1742;containing Immunoglobulin-like fold domain,1230-1303;785-887;1645-1741;containing Dystroglycan-type cadherin-like domain,1223-1311;1647-1747) [Magnetospirillum sp. XM-1]|uniref:DUF4347 domain-containing protein n=1 Tax=Magnetospirillum sp. XM-1 TaxID=1663591 RepID=UPI00073DFA79|nr:DUF4347 domain-containing protein [Magnetospirillum sp. XM-1]CUW40823.1 protein of unknown function\